MSKENKFPCNDCEEKEKCEKCAKYVRCYKWRKWFRDEWNGIRKKYAVDVSNRHEQKSGDLNE